jgi:uncharacterized delta-60 repeat protein
VITNFGLSGRSDVAFDIAIQSDGKIVAAGYSEETSTSERDFALTRYTSSGALDIFTFGKRLTDFGGTETAWDIALQSDGKIIAAGERFDSTSSLYDVALARYNSNGTLDATFSGDGKQVTDFGGDDNNARAVAIQADGKIVLAGDMWNGTDEDFAVYRYKTICADDTQCLDTTFGGGDGMISFGFGSGRRDRAFSIALQPNDGKIVVAGSTHNMNFENGNFAIARLNVDGTLDATFSGDGIRMTDFGGDETAISLALQPDGKIMVVGEKINPTTDLSTFALARYNPNGSLDNTFGQLLSTGKRSGKRVFSILSGTDSTALDVAVQPDGRMVVAGVNDDGTGIFDFAIVRLTPIGAFDKTFSVGGKAIVDFGGNDVAFAVVRQPSDGKYVLGGATLDSTGKGDFALARVLP